MVVAIRPIIIEKIGLNAKVLNITHDLLLCVLQPRFLPVYNHPEVDFLNLVGKSLK